MQPKRRGLIPLILGLLMMFIAAPALLIGGAAYGLRGAVDVAREAQVHPPGDTVALRQGEPVLVLVDVGPASGNALESSSSPTQTCEISSAGVTLTQDATGSGLSANFDGRSWESAGTFAVPADGDYAVTCAGPAKVFTGADVEKLGGSTIMALLFGVLGSLAVGLLGLVLTIVGIVKLVRSGRERRAGGGGYGYGGPGGPPYGAPVPSTPYGTPPQHDSTYAVPPPPGSGAPAGYGSAPYGSTPPPGYGAQPPAYSPPPPGGVTAPIPTSPPGGPGPQAQVPPAPGQAPTPGPASGQAPPPPPPVGGPTYGDPTSP